MTTYKVFHRTWWKYNPKYPNNKEPHAGRKTIIARHKTFEQAIDIKNTWNALNKETHFGRRAEFLEE